MTLCGCICIHEYISNWRKQVLWVLLLRFSYSCLHLQARIIYRLLLVVLLTLVWNQERRVKKGTRGKNVTKQEGTKTQAVQLLLRSTLYHDSLHYINFIQCITISSPNWMTIHENNTNERSKFSKKGKILFSCFSTLFFCKERIRKYIFHCFFSWIPIHIPVYNKRNQYFFLPFARSQKRGKVEPIQCLVAVVVVQVEIVLLFVVCGRVVEIF